MAQRLLCTSTGSNLSIRFSLTRAASNVLLSNGLERDIGSRRWLASGSKKKAMQRQMKNNPSSLPEKQEPPTPVVVPPTSPKSFAPKWTGQDTIPTEASFPSGPIQISPLSSNPSDLLGQWETDKQTRLTGSPSLSSLPEEAALFDKEAMFDPSIHLPYAPQDWKGYEPATPLSEFLMQRIGVSGRPITTAEYMRHALTHPQFGYYTNPPKSKLEKALAAGDSDDVFEDTWDDDVSTSGSKNDSTLIGPSGDFVTAPEVSHVFGHCICVWFVTQWKSTLLNRPSKVQLVELGPGRGTLMVDILQLATSRTLDDFGSSIQVVHLVEASRELRAQQQKALQDALGDKIDFEFVQVSSFAPDVSADTKEESDSDKASDKKEDANKETKKFSIRIEWHDDFKSFQHRRDKDLPTFMVLQEFLDALPVHSFQKTEEGWRERLVDVASTEVDSDAVPMTTGSSNLIPRLRQVLAPGPTPASELFLEPNRQYHQAPVGSVVEICPEALVLAQDMARVLEESKGVALMIDYGQDGTSDTIRAFSNHKQVPLTSYPGQVDVTADVDFFAIRQSVEAASRDAAFKTDRPPVPADRVAHAFGPISQGEFLMRMGAAEMVIHSIEKEETTPEEAQRMTDALKFLVMPEHMGERFKVLALGAKREGIFAPAGMEK